MSSNRYNVQLAIYDLSHGMARALSAQFLGGPQYAIDVIPHTGIVVYGKEYFFGGGIQCEDPNVFRRYSGLHPVQILTLGTTSVAQAHFEEWCRQESTTSGKYHATAYNLLSRNCNNFSHDAALQGLGLQQGVPDWILDVPRRFLSSPMGQFVRPMLENMQLGHVQGAVPLNNIGTPLAAAAAAASTTSNQTLPLTYNNTTSIPNTTPSITNNSRASASSESTKSTSVKSDKTSVATKGTPTLDTYTNYFLSTDTAILNYCAKKMCTWLEVDNDDDESKQRINSCCDSLTKPGAGNEKEELCNQVCPVIHRILQKANEKSKILLPLMFLRVILLHCKREAATDCLQWIIDLITLRNDDYKESILLDGTVRSAIWVVLANALTRKALCSIMNDHNEQQVIAIALSDLSIDTGFKADTRTSAASFLYNFIIYADSTNEASTVGRTDESSSSLLVDIKVSLLCGALEGLQDETNATVLHRRLLIIGRILKPIKSTRASNEEAKTLIIDLGYADALTSLANKSIGSNATKESKEAQQLASEIVSLLNL